MKHLNQQMRDLPYIGYMIKAIGRIKRKIKENYFVFKVWLKNSDTLNKNRVLKDSFKGKECFILGCGPSIKKQDLKVLAGKLSISISNFFVHPDFNIIKPEFHLFPQRHRPLTPEQFTVWWQDAEKYFPPNPLR